MCYLIVCVSGDVWIMRNIVYIGLLCNAVYIGLLYIGLLCNVRLIILGLEKI